RRGWGGEIFPPRGGGAPPPAPTLAPSKKELKILGLAKIKKKEPATPRAWGAHRQEKARGKQTQTATCKRQAGTSAPTTHAPPPDETARAKLKYDGRGCWK